MEIVEHLSRIKTSYIREILSKAVDNRDTISLAGGLPSADAFPMSMIESILPSIARESSLFQYAETPGYRPLIDRYKSQFSVSDDHEVIITNGSQQGLDICARAFIENGDNVVVESPAYLGALQVFAIAQSHILTVDQESDGPDLNQLENHFKHTDVKMFYAVPDFHNPTGRCWSMEKRASVANLCVKYNVLLLEDSPYRELRFRGESLPVVSRFCPSHSILLNSFSKYLAPGIRIAGLETPKKWFPSLCKIKQAMDLHTNIPMQYLVEQAIQHPNIGAHLEQIKTNYKKKYDAMALEMSTLIQYGCSFEAVEGGMFIWLKVPVENTYSLASECIEEGVCIVPGSEFVIEGCANPKAIRLNFTLNSIEVMKEGLARLERVLRRF